MHIVPIPNIGGDRRGDSFPLSLDTLAPPLRDAIGVLFPLRAAHLTTLRPGCVRGNHFHTECHEILLVPPVGRWSLWWDSGDGTAVHNASFDGSEAVAVLISPNCSHAVRNDGESEIHIVGLSDRAYDSDNPDVYMRKIV